MGASPCGLILQNMFAAAMPSRRRFAGKRAYDGRDSAFGVRHRIAFRRLLRHAGRAGGEEGGRRFALRRFLADLDAVRDAEEFHLQDFAAFV